MTEEEAKTKWCPETRLDGHNRYQHGAPYNGYAGTCIGSACMAWRTNVRRDAVGAKIETGYCGKAGAP